MSTMEIVLLIIGLILFVGSFIFSDKESGTDDKQVQKLAKEEINRLVDEKMEEVKNHVDDVVDEAITYSMEKTERSLERLSNEKIMAVNEYSDTVLAEIHRNHEEVMFLYDMLNDKHVTLKDTVSKANQAAKDATNSAKEAENAVNTFQQLSATVLEEPVVKEKPAPKKRTKKAETKEQPLPELEEIPKLEESDLEIEAQNRNSLVLEMVNAGKSSTAIAKELGMGKGEVQLIIDLFHNA